MNPYLLNLLHIYLFLIKVMWTLRFIQSGTVNVLKGGINDKFTEIQGKYHVLKLDEQIKWKISSEKCQCEYQTEFHLNKSQHRWLDWSVSPALVSHCFIISGLFMLVSATSSSIC